MKYVTNTGSLIIRPVGEPMFHEAVTTVSICDEAAGLYVRVAQAGDSGYTGAIDIEPDAWPSIRNAIEMLIEECRYIEEDVAAKDAPKSLDID